MSDTNQSIHSWPPSDPNGKAEKNGYSARFYPGFVRRLAVRAADGRETELYNRGSEPFFLPRGALKPPASSTLEFVRPDGRRLVLQIDDPDQQIDRVEVHLKGTGKGSTDAVPLLEVDGLAPSDQDPPPPSPGEVLICEDGVVLCPPMCPEGPG